MFLNSEEIEDEDSIPSSSSDDTESGESKQSGKKFKKSNRIRHNPTTCIACCMKVFKGKRQRKISSESYRLRTGNFTNVKKSSKVELVFTDRFSFFFYFFRYGEFTGKS